MDLNADIENIVALSQVPDLIAQARDDMAGSVLLREIGFNNAAYELLLASLQSVSEVGEILAESLAKEVSRREGAKSALDVLIASLVSAADSCDYQDTCEPAQEIS